MRIVAAILLLTLAAQAQTTTRPKPARPAGPAVATPAAPPAAGDADPQAREQRIQAARRDIEHMRNLLEQMDRNRAFAAPGETPLNHEFELNIELWRTLLDHLEQDLAAPSASQAAPTQPGRTQ